ncbi:MAG: hypothetical protein WCP34_00265 [Pseudomonadota bacterium]
MKNIPLIAALLAGLTLSAPFPLAMAHDDATLDAQTAPHGGQLRMAGPYHFELVVAKDNPEAKDHPVAVYVTDHAGTQIPTAGASGTATLLVGQQKTRVTLTPNGGNALKGMGHYASSPGLKAIVSITLAGKTTEQARFTPMQIEPPHAGH